MIVLIILIWVSGSFNDLIFIYLVSSIKHRYGIVHYETPIFIFKTWFNGFETTDKYVGGALGFQPNKRMSGPFSSNTTDIRFGGVDKVGIPEEPIKRVLMWYLITIKR